VTFTDDISSVQLHIPIHFNYPVITDTIFTNAHSGSINMACAGVLL